MNVPCEDTATVLTTPPGKKRAWYLPPSSPCECSFPPCFPGLVLLGFKSRSDEMLRVCFACATRYKTSITCQLRLISCSKPGFAIFGSKDLLF